jgi:phytoene/squalene synthetase
MVHKAKLMSYPTLYSHQLLRAKELSAQGAIRGQEKFGHIANAALAASITREASTQTFYTIRYLADRSLVADAYRAYAYFRWVDDMVDQGHITKADRLAFLTRQQAIIARCYQGEWPDNLCPEEYLVADLIHHDQAENSGLRTYVNQMMALMVFDAERKGRFISPRELAESTRSLATAVTEALHYFIGHNDFSPQDDSRYLAVTGAHITHMLRDAIEDAAVGYYNVPQDFLDTHGITPTDVNHDAYQTWVRNRVQLARKCFAAGRAYLGRVENFRCRLAGYAYIARFEVVLAAIEKDGYWLRPAYPERKSKKAGLKMILEALTQTVVSSGPWRQAAIPSAVPSIEASIEASIEVTR